MTWTPPASTASVCQIGAQSNSNPRSQHPHSASPRSALRLREREIAAVHDIHAAGPCPDDKPPRGAAAEHRDGKLVTSHKPDELPAFNRAPIELFAQNQKLESLASSKDVSLPKSPSASQAATKDKLESLSGSSFDQAYVESQLKAHEETASLLKKEISSGGGDPAAKAFAESVLPTIEHHLQAVRTLASEQGVKNAQR